MVSTFSRASPLNKKIATALSNHRSHWSARVLFCCKKQYLDVCRIGDVDLVDGSAEFMATLLRRRICCRELLMMSFAASFWRIPGRPIG